MKRFNRKNGFTLIELMIVIVIIGILSGVLIALLNPVATQNKAKDGVTKATMNKLALGAQAYVSANGRVPSGTEFSAEFTNQVVGVTCTSGSGSCLFTVTAAPLPATCGANNYSGSSNVQCDFYYCGYGGGDTGTASALPASCTTAGGNSDFRIYAKAYNTTNLFMYRSVDSKMYLCDSAGANCQ
jgi:prepilin-type N-terminal cleavage/methylation domain-containing protein